VKVDSELGTAGKARIVQVGTEKQAGTVVLPTLDWLTRTGRAPNRRGGLQSFIDAPTRRCCSCINQQQKRPRWLHPSSTPRRMYALDVAEPPAPLILLFYQVEIRLIQILIIVIPLTAAHAARQYHETVAIAG
jgi:hypothetical protein